MSDMPARTFGEADRIPQTQNRSTPTTTSSFSGPASAIESVAGLSKHLPAAGLSSPKSPSRRPRNPPPGSFNADVGDKSAEEDELSDEISPDYQDDGDPLLHRRRTATPKRKEVRLGPASPNPKRSKMTDAGSPPQGRVESSQSDVLVRERGGFAPRKSSRSRSPSPNSRMAAPRIERAESQDSVSQPQRTLSLDEIDIFLDLVYKHHPKPMTAENMRRSVDALYYDWEQFCVRRQVPVILAKKPLMDEFYKIFHGVYGPEFQAKARSIAQELSQRDASSFSGGDAASDKEPQRRDSSSRRSLTHSSSDEDSEEDDANDGDDAMTGDVGASSLRKVGGAAQGVTEDTEPGSSKKSNIAQVGRNGLAVLPPGLFDILRNHLRDDILSSIMPSVRNDLTEQTRELFLQNQDLFGRIKEMEDRIRNQDLWIRHLLSRDPTEMSTPSVGPPTGAIGPASGESTSGFSSKVRPFSGATRDLAGPGRLPHHVPNEGEMGGGVPTSDYLDAVGPMSPRQPPRNDHKHFAQHGIVGPHSREARSPAVVAGSAMGTGPVSGPAYPFAHGRWEAEVPPSNIYRDRPPHERRPSHTYDSNRRPAPWQSEVQAGRNLRPHSHPNERGEMPEGRFEVPAGPQPGDPRTSFGDRRRLSAFSGGASGPRDAAPAPPFMSTGPAPPMSGLHDEFRRPGSFVHPRESVTSPIEPIYDPRRPHSRLPASWSEPYFGGSEPTNAPLPHRAAMPASPEQMQKNKRGRPSKAEMANSRADFGSSSHGSLSSASHPQAQSRPYFS